MELTQESFFEDIDKFTSETEEYSRNIFSSRNDWNKLNDLLKTYTGFLQSATKDTGSEAARDSGLHYKVGISVKSVRVLFPYLYVSIKGFYDEANAFVRNFVELSLILIDIGYNNESLVYWKNGKPGEFSDIKSVLKRIDKNKDNIPKVDWGAVRYFKDKYYQISQDFSHELKLQNIEKIFKLNGSVKFSDRANEEFTIMRMKSFQSLILNAISLLVGVTNYSELVNRNSSNYPEAIQLKTSYEKLSGEFEKLKHD